MRISPKRASGATLAALRRATASDHDSVDGLITLNGLVDVGYYATVVRGLIESAEMVEATLPLIPERLRREGLSPSEVSKRGAIDAATAFLDDLVGPRLHRDPVTGDDLELVPGPPLLGTILGLLYVYVGSTLGGLQLLRVVQTAPWWRPERERMLLRPYGDHLKDRWWSVLNALERLDLEETTAAVTAARACFDVHRRSLVNHLSVDEFR